MAASLRYQEITYPHAFNIPARVLDSVCNPCLLYIFRTITS